MCTYSKRFTLRNLLTCLWRLGESKICRLGWQNRDPEWVDVVDEVQRPCAGGIPIARRRVSLLLYLCLQVIG